MNAAQRRNPGRRIFFFFVMNKSGFTSAYRERWRIILPSVKDLWKGANENFFGFIACRLLVSYITIWWSDADMPRSIYYHFKKKACEFLNYSFEFPQKFQNRSVAV